MNFKTFLLQLGIDINTADKALLAKMKTRYAVELKASMSSEMPGQLRFSGGTGSAELLAAKDDDGDGLRRVKLNSYNGGMIRVNGFFSPVVVDISGVRVTAKSRPILFGHDSGRPVGHTEETQLNARNIKQTAILSVPNADQEMIIASSDNGFPWQASIGVFNIEGERIAEGEKATANGRTFKGPFVMIRKGDLQETSILSLGADDSTTVKIAASVAEIETELNMDPFKKWLKACGIDHETATPELLASMQVKFDEQLKLEADNEALKIEAGKKIVKEEPTSIKAEAPVVDVKKLVAEGISEALKIQAAANKIETLTEGHEEIRAEAKEKGWGESEVQKAVELKTIRAGYAPGIGINMNDKEVPATQCIEAAIMQAGGMDEKQVIAATSEKVLEAADKRYRGQMGLQELIVEAAHANGYRGGHSFFRDPNAIFAAAFSPVRAGFSTLSLPGILSNAGNKFFKEGFMAVENNSADVSSKKNVNDFKEHTTYTLNADMEYKKLAPGGKIEHATVGETSYGNKADTYARMFSISRTDIINDDLGALTTVPRRLGRGAAIAWNKVFWTEFLNHVGFYAVGNNNLTSGLAFGIDEITEMLKSFREQTDPDGNPMGVSPQMIVVPPALEVLALKIFNDDLLITGTGAEITNGNPHKGKFKVITSSYIGSVPALSAQSSDIASYMLANPMDVSVIESAFLRGKETPTVESAQADFNTLGVQFRGFHDFGVRLQEFRGGVKSAGA